MRIRELLLTPCGAMGPTAIRGGVYSPIWGAPDEGTGHAYVSAASLIFAPSGVLSPAVGVRRPIFKEHRGVLAAPSVHGLCIAILGL